ncbi:MAG: hypothetical protein HeimC2_43470 [Candidatus Heimdallarchaeota archaeon LC_2]|nr:MAG: hypothetical protein HeimC2_43470 [Candidatus Heimdallarchaeota archaeon LC_2]
MIIDRTIPLTSAQSIFLMIIKGSNQPMSGSEIVERIRLHLGANSVPTAGAVYKILNFLEDHSYIEKRFDDIKRKDKRFKTYGLTTLGLKMVDQVSKHIQKIFSFMCVCCEIVNIEIPGLKLIQPGISKN